MKTRMAKYKDNESNVWALIYDQCSPELAKNKLKKTEGYEGAKGRCLIIVAIILPPSHHPPLWLPTTARFLCS